MSTRFDVSDVQVEVVEEDVFPSNGARLQDTRGNVNVDTSVKMDYLSVDNANANVESNQTTVTSVTSNLALYEVLKCDSPH